jgi:hypothetical protein
MPTVNWPVNAAPSIVSYSYGDREFAGSRRMKPQIASWPLLLLILHAGSGGALVGEMGTLGDAHQL